MDFKALLPRLLTITIFFVVLFIYTKLAGPIPFSVDSVTTNKTDIFTVSGTGKSTMKPDTAVVSAGVETSGPTVKSVQDDLNNKINKVSASLKDIGIRTEDIQTLNYNINPSYDFRGETRRVTGYQASTNLKIKVKDLEKVNAVLDSVTVSGANQVGGVSFEVEDKAKAENEARQKAVADAKRKADLAAQAAGFKLGKVINYSENYAGDGRMSPVYSLQVEKATDSGTQVEPGSSEVTVLVHLSYEIK